LATSGEWRTREEIPLRMTEIDMIGTAIPFFPSLSEVRLKAIENYDYLEEDG